MCKMFLSFLIDVYVIFLYWNIQMNCTQFIFICHLLMMTYFHVENVPQFQYCFWLFTDVNYFSCAKCSYHFQLMFMWLTCTETYRWTACSSSSFLIYWCWHIFVWKMFENFNIAVDYYWCWLFFMCKMLLSFSIDVYVIFLYWNILMNCTHFIFIGHLLMLTYFCMENVPEFQYCFWLFTDVDYFSCAKCSYHLRLMCMWFSCTETYRWTAHSSSSFLIYWCWHIFIVKMFHNFNTAFWLLQW